MKKVWGLGVALQIALGFICPGSMVFSSEHSDTTSDWTISFNLTAIVDADHEGSQERVKLLEDLLSHGNQYGYYTSGYSIKNISDVVNISSNISKQVPSAAKLIISFGNIGDFRSESKSFVIKSHQSQLNVIPTNVYGVVFNVMMYDKCDAQLLRLRTKLFQPLQQLKFAIYPVKVGIGLKAENIGCRYLPLLIQVSDFVIASISFEAKTLPESYGLFSVAMDEYTRNSSGVVFDKKGSKRSLIYLVTLQQGNTSTPSSKEYISLLEDFASKWADANGSNVILDLPDYSTLTQGGSRSVRNDVAGPSTLVIPSWHDSATASALIDSYPFAFNFISSTFRYLHLKDSLVGNVTRNWHNSLQHWPYSTRLSHPLDIILEIYHPTEKSLRKLLNQAPPLVQSLDTLKTDNVNVKVVEFAIDRKYSGDIRSAEVDKILGDVELGCLVLLPFQWDPANIIKTTKDACGVLFEKASRFTWFTSLSLGSDQVSLKFYLETTRPRLEVFLKARTELLKIKPNVNVVVKFSHEKFYMSDMITRNFYCSERFQEINIFYEAVLNWGRIHNFPILWKEAILSNRTFGWWSQIEPGSEIGEEVGVVPHFVLRNHPKNIVNWKAAPCFDWSTEGPTEDIQFSNKYAGAVVDMGVRQKPLTVQELQTMLVLSLQKFSSLEILVDHNEPHSAEKQVQILREALSTNFEELLEANAIRDGWLHVQVLIPTGGLQRSGIVDEIKKLGEIAKKSTHFSLEGIHLTNWESLRQQDLSTLVQVGGKHYVKVGLSVENCPALINSLPISPDQITLLSIVDYILCETKSTSPKNDMVEFARYMDSQLYLSSAFSNFHLNVRVHFRLNSYPCCEGDSEETQTANMLRFLSHVNQFAGGNELKYFLVQAFTQSSKSASWWRIENYVDLTNVSVYVDNEAKFRKVATWTPKLITPRSSTSPESTVTPYLNVSSSSTSSEASSNWAWIYYTMYAFGLMLFISLLAVTVILYIRVRKKFRLLSEYEVQEFLNGSGAVRFAATTQQATIGKEKDYTRLKFDNNFSLAKEDFKFDANCDLLGSGNFGRVLRAILGAAEVVAVKIPHDGCPKESFKSMLSEVKVMSYVGTHANVVTFVGAYIKEISNGVIYIATELCENGSLIEYLHTLPQSTPDKPDDRVCAQELFRFSLEIASGMEYIGSKNVVHGDLAARNILLNSHNTCKITDFGLSRKLYEYNKYVKKNQEPLPWRWMAPESLTRMEFTTMSDVWSYGVTLWEIFTLGDTPYPGMAWTINFTDELRDGLRLPKPRMCNAEMYSRIFSCWNLVSDARPTFTCLKEYMEGVLNREYTSLG